MRSPTRASMSGWPIPKRTRPRHACMGCAHCCRYPTTSSTSRTPFGRRAGARTIQPSTRAESPTNGAGGGTSRNEAASPPAPTNKRINPNTNAVFARPPPMAASPTATASPPVMVVQLRSGPEAAPSTPTRALPTAKAAAPTNSGRPRSACPIDKTLRDLSCPATRRPHSVRFSPPDTRKGQRSRARTGQTVNRCVDLDSFALLPRGP